MKAIEYKKVWWTVIVILIIVLGGIWVGKSIKDYNERQNQYYVFMEVPSEAAIRSLENHDIPYVIDEKGRLKIKKKYDEKVVACCT